jgi:hypothetical protein
MPVFYALWATSVATANRSALLAPLARGGSAPPLVRAHALREAREKGATRVVVIHKDPAAPPVGVRVAGCGGAPLAALLRLSAPSVAASSGVSFGGETLDGAEDGLPVPGGPPAEALAAAGGVFSFSVPAGSAAVLCCAAE